MQALDRPFDPLIDARYAGDLVETVRGSAPGLLGVLLLVGAVGGLLAITLVVPLALVRVTRAARRHRPATLRVLAVLAPLWLASTLLGVRVGTVPVASDSAAAYAYAQVARVPSRCVTSASSPGPPRRIRSTTPPPPTC